MTCCNLDRRDNVRSQGRRSKGGRWRLRWWGRLWDMGIQAYDGGRIVRVIMDLYGTMSGIGCGFWFLGRGWWCRGRKKGRMGGGWWSSWWGFRDWIWVGGGGCGSIGLCSRSLDRIVGVWWWWGGGVEGGRWRLWWLMVVTWWMYDWEIGIGIWLKFGSLHFGVILILSDLHKWTFYYLGSSNLHPLNFWFQYLMTMSCHTICRYSLI